MKTSGYNKKNKYKIVYSGLSPIIRPVPLSAKIQVPVFCQLPSFIDQDPDEKIIDSYDAGFEIKDDPTCRVFGQNELNDLVKDLVQ